MINFEFFKNVDLVSLKIVKIIASLKRWMYIQHFFNNSLSPRLEKEPIEMFKQKSMALKNSNSFLLLLGSGPTTFLGSAKWIYKLQQTVEKNWTKFIPLTRFFARCKTSVWVCNQNTPQKSANQAPFFSTCRLGYGGRSGSFHQNDD